MVFPEEGSKDMQVPPSLPVRPLHLSNAPYPSPAETSTRPCYLPLWSLVPQEEVGGEASLPSGLGCCQRKLPGPLWCLGWLGRRGKGWGKARERMGGVLSAAPPAAHRNALPRPPMSSATPPSTPTRLTSLSFSPLQLGAQDSLSMGGDVMGTSTTTPPQPFSWECGLPTMRAPGLRRAGLDQSSEAGALSPRPSDSGLTKRGLEDAPHAADIYRGPWRLPSA